MKVVEGNSSLLGLCQEVSLQNKSWRKASRLLSQGAQVENCSLCQAHPATQLWFLWLATCAEIAWCWLTTVLPDHRSYREQLVHPASERTSVGPAKKRRTCLQCADPSQRKPWEWHQNNSSQASQVCPLQSARVHWLLLSRIRKYLDLCSFSHCESFNFDLAQCLRWLVGTGDSSETWAQWDVGFSSEISSRLYMVNGQDKVQQGCVELTFYVNVTNGMVCRIDWNADVGQLFSRILTALQKNLHQVRRNAGCVISHFISQRLNLVA